MPWAPSVFTEISIDIDREVASEKAAALLDALDTVVYSDAAASNTEMWAAFEINDYTAYFEEITQH